MCSSTSRTQSTLSLVITESYGSIIDYTMDCELCLEEFNNQEHLPKVLSQCGHTFCDKCVMQLWDNSMISCPFCR